MYGRMLENPIRNLLIIVLLFACWFLVVPPFIGLYFLYLYCKEIISLCNEKEQIKQDQKDIENTYKRFNEDRFLN